MKNLEGLTVKELKVLCKEYNVVGYSKMHKAELVEILNKIDIKVDTIENAEITTTTNQTIDINIEELAQNRKLKIDANTGNLVKTKGQERALRFLVYNFKIKIDVNKVTTRRTCSEMITKIYEEIRLGNVQKRTTKHTNQQVKVINGYYTLVANK